MSYWETVVPTYIENWPPGLCSMSIPQVDVPLTLAEALRLGTNMIDYGEAFCQDGIVANITDIRERVAEAVARMPSGAFVRLGSRSPKDSWLGYKEGFRVRVATDPLRFLLDASERIYEDLTLALQNEYPPHIFVRQWLTIAPWQEFRCFMRARKLVGISQYNYLEAEVFPEIVADAEAIRWAIEQAFSRFRGACHLADVVFDVIVERKTMRDNTRIWEVKLLEINPFFELTDPCLFSWKDGFNGEFRFNGG